MHFGIVIEGDYREGATQDQAFQEAYDLVDAAEGLGLDGVWLAERHFAAPASSLDPMGAAIPSIVSTPMILATAVAARTQRVRVGIAVSVLPLNHPVRMAEEAATLDNISNGRLDFGVGRSGFMRAYEGYGIPYEESRPRFRECLEVITRAWTNHRFSYEGDFYQFDNVCVMPKPFQTPHPPIRIAATTGETFPAMGELGYPIFVGLRGMDLPELKERLKVYREEWNKAGHPGNGDVILRMPVYVADTDQHARDDAETSTMRAYERLAATWSNVTVTTPGVTGLEERAEQAKRIAGATFDDILRDRLAYGSPETVIARINEVREDLGISGIIAELNVGGRIPKELVFDSLNRLGKQVIPSFR